MGPCAEDVSRLIEGLHSGKLSAEYIEKRMKEKEDDKVQVVKVEKERVEKAEKRKYDNLPDEKKKEVKDKVRETGEA